MLQQRRRWRENGVRWCKAETSTEYWCVILNLHQILHKTFLITYAFAYDCHQCIHFHIAFRRSSANGSYNLSAMHVNLFVKRTSNSIIRSISSKLSISFPLIWMISPYEALDLPKSLWSDIVRVVFSSQSTCPLFSKALISSTSNAQIAFTHKSFNSFHINDFSTFALLRFWDKLFYRSVYRCVRIISLAKKWIFERSISDIMGLCRNKWNLRFLTPVVTDASIDVCTFAMIPSFCEQKAAEAFTRICKDESWIQNNRTFAKLPFNKEAMTHIR